MTMNAVFHDNKSLEEPQKSGKLLGELINTLEHSRRIFLSRYTPEN